MRITKCNVCGKEGRRLGKGSRRVLLGNELKASSFIKINKRERESAMYYPISGMAIPHAL